MNRFALITFILILLIFHIACSSGSSERNSNAANTAVNNPANQPVANSNGAQLQPAYNGETKEVADGYPVPVNANVTVIDGNQAKDTMKTLPAPDDSTFSAEMNAKGQPVETRTFKSHPVLAKVEKITTSPREYVFKVYLKNGKVIESKSEKLKDFRVIAPVNILDAVGIKPPQPKPDPNAPKAEDLKKPVLIPKANP